jgi:RNA polymerase sigma-70 factor (ECF subfamily)
MGWEPDDVTEDIANADVGLLRRIAEGDSGALGEFYDRHAGTLFALAVRIVRDPKEAEDVVQEVFVQLWDRASLFDPAQGRPLAWAITLTRHKAIDHLRSARRRARLADEAGEQAEVALSPGSPAPGLGRDESEHLCLLLAGLPADQRRAIEMAFFGGLSQTEIAAALNEPLGTVKARIRRGMLKLREGLESRV